MLILTRRIGELIVINGNIEVILLGITGNQARLGINAPAEVSVHREEVHKRIQDALTLKEEGEQNELS